MSLKDIDIVKVTRISSQQIDLVTCLECCKYFKIPTTASCGHTLCKTCWLGRGTCHTCGQPFDNLRYNQHLHSLTEHVHEYTERFKMVFNIDLNDFLIDSNEPVLIQDPNRNVKEWLASSQNNFSAPPLSSDPSSQEIQPIPNPLEVSSNKIQIHTSTRKTTSPEKVIHVPIPQDDWDKIELMPEAMGNNKNKENVVGPMDIEPFDFDDYTVNNPRRSSRNKEIKKIDGNNKPNEQCSIEKHSSKDSSGEIDKKSNKTKQNWNNVKKMRKEFSKLGKKNKSKLNVSIEMCKKTQNAAEHGVKLPQAPSINYDIDENTPDNTINIAKQKMTGTFKCQDKVEEKKAKEITPSKCYNYTDTKTEKIITKDTHTLNKAASVQDPTDSSLCHKNNIESTIVEIDPNPKVIQSNNLSEEKPAKLSFYKKSALCPHVGENKIQTVKHDVYTNTNANDDIQITIKIGTTITSINIKNKNVVDVKVNTDREIQTSPSSHDLIGKIHTPLSQKTNIEAVNSQPKTNAAVGTNITSVKGASDKTKKNTDSADTATVQFEITESVEKELSKVMEHVEIEVKSTKSGDIIVDKTNLQKPVEAQSNQENLDYLNDLDIFESESVKELNVQSLKNTEHVPSEILTSTVTKHTKNKTQKHTTKHNRDYINDGDSLPKSKKAKLTQGTSKKINETIETQKTNLIPTDSEPLNYDSIMGKVFASIDADIAENPQSKHVDKNTYTLTDNNKTVNYGKTSNNKLKDLPKHVNIKSKTDCSVNLGEYCEQKDSENVFSACLEKYEQNINAASNEKVPPNVPTNVEDFLTPVHRDQEAIEEVIVVDNDVYMDNDSDKSVVEDTPQKSSPFTVSKAKQKNEGVMTKEINLSQRIVKEITGKVLSEKNRVDVNDFNKTQSIVELTDSSVEMKTNKDVTVIETVKKLNSVETPININKFVDQLKHKSTPVSRKSLNFENENVEDIDPERTLCSTINDVVARTTQEKEFLNKAFEKTLTPTRPAIRNLGHRPKKFCIAGSCLSENELCKVKLLCARNKWTYYEKYSPNLTHLVVSVDEENKVQRTVKYMCALASSIWIISYEWVEKCLKCKEVVNEECYEVLDSTGEPGPRRSRIASNKLFEGITFFCMEPFSIVPVDSLKYMLEAAGGKVVNEVQEVYVTDNTTTPLLFLAEPEDTQEDKYVYQALQRSIVPVNFEWALNCLGSYTLSAIENLLLCPASLLPKVTEKWPKELVSRDEN